MSCPNCGCSGGGRRKRSSKAKRSRSNRKSRIALPLRYFGVGGRPTLPSEYFGGDSGKYLAAGNSDLNPCPLNVPTSHGTLTGEGLMGPDIHPGPYPAGNQTAGSRKRRSRVDVKAKDVANVKAKDVPNVKAKDVANVKVADVANVKVAITKIKK